VSQSGEVDHHVDALKQRRPIDTICQVIDEHLLNRRPNVKGRLVAATTWCPRAIRAGIRCRPTKPPAPVISKRRLLCMTAPLWANAEY
jgi:hypothetical protein